MNVHSFVKFTRQPNPVFLLIGSFLTHPTSNGLLIKQMRQKLEILRIPASRILKNFPPSRRYLIGVSGGRDSVALLHWLSSLGYRKLIVCHLDHELRGRASQVDARFVASMAARLGLNCEIGRTDVRRLTAQSKLSIETAARAARSGIAAHPHGR